MLMDKNQLPVVAIESMNKTHADEVDIINELYDLIASSLNGNSLDEELDRAISQFRDHVDHHFSSEEKLMEQSGFPAYSVHKGEHDRVRAVLFSIIDLWQETRIIQPLADYLENVHPNWAKNHIATMDTMTAHFISQSSRTSEQPDELM